MTLLSPHLSKIQNELNGAAYEHAVEIRKFLDAWAKLHTVASLEREGYHHLSIIDYAFRGRTCIAHCVLFVEESKEICVATFQIFPSP